MIRSYQVHLVAPVKVKYKRISTQRSDQAERLPVKSWNTGKQQINLLV